jgi:MoaA/NifB/PqqE/SkfB family radical SAM enzyme
MIKIKCFPNNNYRAIFNSENGQTIRQKFHSNLPYKPLEFPEILDISLGTKCFANCSFCYTSAIKNGENYENVVEKIENFFGKQSENERPFQVAIGGGGEPTLHPKFVEVLKSFHGLGIMPNYTTNGMHLNNKIIKATKKYSGGVAVSCHPHLTKVWEKAIDIFIENKIKTNLHIIIGEKNSVDYFLNIYKKYHKKIDYFVLLPYQSVGRAKKIEVEKEWEKLFEELKKFKNFSNIAFGALFYDYFLKNKKILKFINISIYPSEDLSGYLMLNNEKLIIRKSCYNLNPKFK